MTLTTPDAPGGAKPSWTWKCVDCGIPGSLYKPGVGPRPGICSRRGLAVMKGAGRCCVCAQATKWQGFQDCGCRTCFARLSEPFPQKRIRSDRLPLCITPPPAVASCIPWRARAQPWSKKNGVPEHLPQSFKLAIFGFDDCLFRTPNRPADWPFQSYREMPQSLGSGLVPTAPAKDWFNERVVAAASEAIKDPDTVTALVSTRRSLLQGRIVEMLEGEGAGGLRFDEALLMPLTTGAWSARPPRGAAEAMNARGVTTTGVTRMRDLPTKVQAACFQLYAVTSLLERYPLVTTVDAFVADAATGALLTAAATHLEVNISVHIAQVTPHAPEPVAAEPEDTQGAIASAAAAKKAPASRPVSSSSVTCAVYSTASAFPADALERSGRMAHLKENYSDKERRGSRTSRQMQASFKSTGLVGSSTIGALAALGDDVGTLRPLRGASGRHVAWNGRVAERVHELRGMGYSSEVARGVTLADVAAATCSTGEAVDLIMLIAGDDDEGVAFPVHAVRTSEFHTAQQDWPPRRRPATYVEVALAPPRTPAPVAPSAVEESGASTEEACCEGELEGEDDGVSTEESLSDRGSDEAPTATTTTGDVPASTADPDQVGDTSTIAPGTGGGEEARGACISCGEERVEKKRRCRLAATNKRLEKAHWKALYTTQHLKHLVPPQHCVPQVVFKQQQPEAQQEERGSSAGSPTTTSRRIYKKKPWKNEGKGKESIYVAAVGREVGNTIFRYSSWGAPPKGWVPPPGEVGTTEYF